MLSLPIHEYAGYSDLPDDLYATARWLLHLHWDASWPVRLVGVALCNLINKGHDQYDLFGVKERQVKLAKACDAIRDRYGEKAILRGVSLTEAS